MEDVQKDGGKLRERPDGGLGVASEHGARRGKGKGNEGVKEKKKVKWEGWNAPAPVKSAPVSGFM